MAPLAVKGRIMMPPFRTPSALCETNSGNLESGAPGALRRAPSTYYIPFLRTSLPLYVIPLYLSIPLTQELYRLYPSIPGLYPYQWHPVCTYLAIFTVVEN